MPSIRAFFVSLPADDQEAVARECGTSVVYLRNHMLAGRRRPRPALLARFIESVARRNGPSRRQILDDLFGPPREDISMVPASRQLVRAKT